MAHVTAPGIQAWLQSTKLTIDVVDVDKDSVATNLVFGRVGTLYDTSTWTDASNTPALIQTIMCMLLAAWTYRVSYAEVVEVDNPFATWLETLAEQTIQAILTGSIEVVGATPRASDITSATAWPNDTTGSTQQFDARGIQVGFNEFSEDIKFRMGTRF